MCESFAPYGCPHPEVEYLGVQETLDPLRPMHMVTCRTCRSTIFLGSWVCNTLDRLDADKTLVFGFHTLPRVKVDA